MTSGQDQLQRLVRDKAMIDSELTSVTSQRDEWRRNSEELSRQLQSVQSQYASTLDTNREEYDMKVEVLRSQYELELARVATAGVKSLNKYRSQVRITGELYLFLSFISLSMCVLL